MLEGGGKDGGGLCWGCCCGAGCGGRGSVGGVREVCGRRVVLRGWLLEGGGHRWWGGGVVWGVVLVVGVRGG